MAALLSAGGALAAQPAAADDGVFCGDTVWKGDVSFGGFSDYAGEQAGRQLGEVLDFVGLDENWCGTAEALQQLLLKRLFPITPVGALNSIKGVNIKIPGAVNRLLREAKKLWEQYQAEHASDSGAEQPATPQAQLPAELPRVGPSGVDGRVFGTGSQGLWMHRELGSKIGTVPDGTVVHLLCQTTWVDVPGPYGTTNLWDRVLVEGRDEPVYLSDAYVFTGSNDRVTPDC